MGNSFAYSVYIASWSSNVVSCGVMPIYIYSIYWSLLLISNQYLYSTFLVSFVVYVCTFIFIPTDEIRQIINQYILLPYLPISFSAPHRMRDLHGTFTLSTCTRDSVAPTNSRATVDRLYSFVPLILLISSVKFMYLLPWACFLYTRIFYLFLLKILLIFNHLVIVAIPKIGIFPHYLLI